MSHIQRPSSLRADSAAGFTLIETTIALVLLVIVLAFVGRPIIDGFGGANKATSTASAERAVGDATDRFRTDIQAALTPDRDTSNIRDHAKLKRALTDASFVARSDDPTPGVGGKVLDVADIYVATPKQVMFRADVLSESRSPGAECVSYTSLAPSAGRFSLRRVVRAGTSCTSGAILTDEMLVNNAPQVTGATPPDLFRYSYLRTGSCATGIAPLVTGTTRNRIVGIDIRLSTIVVRGAAASQATGQDLVSIRSRSASDYRRALGC